MTTQMTLKERSFAGNHIRNDFWSTIFSPVQFVNNGTNPGKFKKKCLLKITHFYCFYNNHSRSTYTVIGSNSLGKLINLYVRISGDCRLNSNIKYPYP